MRLDEITCMFTSRTHFHLVNPYSNSIYLIIVIPPMPAVPGSVYGQRTQPSCWDKVKYGFMLGACVGLASGAIFGGVSALRYS